MAIVQTEQIKKRFQNKSWHYPNGVTIQTHQYDEILYAFEVTQYKQCLGTIIPEDIQDMLVIEHELNNHVSLHNRPCNDDFDTIIKIM